MKTVHRCAWAGPEGPMRDYHDTEWGVPEHDSRALWEKLILDGFQAGLSWKTILLKRDAFRKAFRQFDPKLVARFTPADVDRLLQDAGIVRSRAKIQAAIGNAQAYLAMAAAGEDFSRFIWDMAGGKVVRNAWASAAEVPAHTELSHRMSKALKQRGFKFVGPTIVYAWLEACGVVNDHLTSCFRYRQ
jgi:DNA-3-methyladenine glycosylase I